jgi:7-cyano-7-deazaguanine synthase
MSKRAVTIYSGGADSTVILHHCMKQYDEVYALTFNYNQRHKAEIDRAIEYTKCKNITHKIVDLSFYSTLANSSALTNLSIDVPKMKDVIGDPQNAAYCPNRNMVMLSIAAAYAESVEANDIYYGAAAVDNLSGYFDCTEIFLETLNNALALNRRNIIKIHAPLITMSKKEIIHYGIELGVDFSKTLTCYNGTDIACGECPSCSARIKGFFDSGYIDPVPYNRTINWKECKEIKQ